MKVNMTESTILLFEPCSFLLSKMEIIKLKVMNSKKQKNHKLEEAAHQLQFPYTRLSRKAG